MDKCTLCLSPTTFIEIEFSNTFEEFVYKLLLFLNISPEYYKNDFSKKIFFCYFDKNIWYPMTDDNTFQNAKAILNCKIMIQVYINVLVSTEPNKRNFPAKFIAELYFKSHLGIDKSFLEKLNNCIKSHATSSKANEDSFQPYLVDINNQLHELKTANIFEYKCFCILLRKSKGYSLFTIDDVELNFTWASGLNEKETRYFNIWNGISTSDQLTKNIKECEEIDDFEKKVDVTMTSLNYLRRLLEPENCCCESTRRLILNILLLSALQCNEPIHFSVNTEFKLNDEGHNTLRVGNGPFDYFVIGKKQAFIALVLDKLVESSDLSNQNEDEILPAPTVIEAKTDIDVCELPKALGQLVAQMIDTLNIVSSRKRSHDTMLCGSSHALEMVKGMLSTGHHNMFFSLTKGNSSESKPVLNYYGKYSINILKRKPGRNSGLEQFEEIKKSEIELILRAIFCFVTHEY